MAKNKQKRSKKKKNIDGSETIEEEIVDENG